jgi:catalase
MDKEALHAETDKKSDLAHDTVEPGEVMSGNQGVKISDDQNSLKAGLRGPTLLEDFHLREKITHFDHERIAERVVHARGAAAHGVFQVYEDLSDLTMAGLLTDPSRQTPVFVRFSTVAGSRGSTDCARDVRGFAVKFYTDEGVWDLVWQQHAGLLHSGCNQVSRPDPCGKARAEQRNSAGGLGA